MYEKSFHDKERVDNHGWQEQPRFNVHRQLRMGVIAGRSTECFMHEFTDVGETMNDE